MLTVGSLFAGIGGFDLGLERAGMRSVWQCELNPFCERVLAHHWPDVLRLRDVRDVNAGTVPAVDVVAGGFPCQPVSRTGLRAAQDDDRWLWPEFRRVVDDLRPRYVIVENVPGLLDGGIGDVLRDLAALGFDAEWDCLPAGAFGAGHVRDRVWLVAYPQGEHGPSPRVLEPGALRRASTQPRRLPRHLVDQGRLRTTLRGVAAPDVPVLVHGVPELVAGCGAVGNALDPYIAELIGRQIIAYETSNGFDIAA